MAGIIDALGHGDDAHDFGRKIHRFLEDSKSRSLGPILESLHQRFKGERGAALGLCLLEKKSGLLRYAGVGNTLIRVVGEQDRYLISTEGVIGHHIHTTREQSCQLRHDDMVILCTDGVSSHFSLPVLPRLLEDHEARLAKL